MIRVRWGNIIEEKRVNFLRGSRKGLFRTSRNSLPPSTPRNILRGFLSPVLFIKGSPQPTLSLKGKDFRKFLVWYIGRIAQAGPRSSTRRRPCCSYPPPQAPSLPTILNQEIAGLLNENEWAPLLSLPAQFAQILGELTRKYKTRGRPIFHWLLRVTSHYPLLLCRLVP